MQTETGSDEPRLSAKFLEEYRKWSQQMDHLFSNKYEGAKMEQVADKFIADWEGYMSQFPFVTPPDTWSISMAPSSQQSRADLQILDRESQVETELVPYYARVLGRVWHRAAIASYFRRSSEVLKNGKAIENRVPLYRMRRAIRYDPLSCLIVMWHGIAASFYLEGVTSGYEKLEIAHLIRTSCERCIELDGLGSWLAIYMLGRVHHSMSTLSWMEKVAVKACGYDKLLVTHREAEEQFLLSHKLKPQWLPNCLWLAKIYLDTKRPAEARKWLELGLKMPVDEPALEINLIELKDLQKDHRLRKSP